VINPFKRLRKLSFIHRLNTRKWILGQVRCQAVCGVVIVSWFVVYFVAAAHSVFKIFFWSSAEKNWFAEHNNCFDGRMLHQSHINFSQHVSVGPEFRRTSSPGLFRFHPPPPVLSLITLTSLLPLYHRFPLTLHNLTLELTPWCFGVNRPFQTDVYLCIEIEKHLVLWNHNHNSGSAYMRWRARNIPGNIVMQDMRTEVKVESATTTLHFCEHLWTEKRSCCFDSRVPRNSGFCFQISTTVIMLRWLDCWVNIWDIFAKCVVLRTQKLRFINDWLQAEM